MDLRKIGIDERTGFGWLRIGSSGGGGFCKHGNKSSTFHKESRLLFDKLSDYQIFKKLPQHIAAEAEGNTRSSQDIQQWDESALKRIVA
jgi:hypothetical protein